MKFNELKPLVVYRITKDSSDGTFTKDLLIWISTNGDINCAWGFISPNEENLEKTLDFEAVVDYNHYVNVTATSESIAKRPYEVKNTGMNILLKPVIVHSGDKYAYHCPLCESLGVGVVVGDGEEWRQKSCPNCGVNLAW